jgi:hypothetical protein
MLPGEQIDDPLEPSVSLQESRAEAPAQRIKEERRNRKYFATPWKDWSRDAHEKTGQNRGRYYMGCKNAEGC